MSHNPTNIIYTGVAGTGKTYQLLHIAKQYTDYFSSANEEELLNQLLQNLSWRDVLCLVFLDFKSKQQDLVKVSELTHHEFFIAKASQNARDKNLNSTAWLELRRHSPIDSKTVSCDNRASQAYFDKDTSGSWYLLSESMPLLTALTQQLSEFKQVQQDNTARDNNTFSQQRFSMVSFHQAYGYEEFVEGIRPVMGSNKHAQISYDIQDGAFLTLCRRAAADPKQRYAMLIDEINRANVSRVFGELLSLIEPDKRAGLANAMQVSLAYSGRAFSVPANVDIYATMNTQDHSLAPLDMALRRRFNFIDCPPQPELLPIISIAKKVAENVAVNEPVETIDLAKVLSGLNRRIIHTLGQEAQLGHAFLFSVQNLSQLQTALTEQIIPQLAQAASSQVAILQYLFKDEQQPYSSQFIHDSQAVINGTLHDPSNIMPQDQMFAEQNVFLGQSMNASGYLLNPDLIAKTGKFITASIYQRLY